MISDLLEVKLLSAVPCNNSEDFIFSVNWAATSLRFNERDWNLTKSHQEIFSSERSMKHTHTYLHVHTDPLYNNNDNN